MKKLFVTLCTTFIIISAIIAIFFVMFGTFKETEARILLTTILLGGYSLMGLCCAALLDRKKNIILAIGGMVIIVTACIATMIIVWEIVTPVEGWKTIVISAMVSASMAHICLLQIKSSAYHIEQVVRILTFIGVVIVNILIIFAIVTDFESIKEIFWRVLGVCTILVVLGTIGTPIIQTLSQQEKTP